MCATCIVNAMMLKRSPGQDFALEGQPPIPTRHRPQGSGSMRQRRTTKKMAKHEMDLDNRGSLQPLRKAGDTPCCQSHAWNIAPGGDSRSNKNMGVRNCCSTAPSSSSRKASSFPLERMAHGLGPVQCTGVSKSNGIESNRIEKKNIKHRIEPSTQKKKLNPSPRGARCASNKVGAPPLQHLH